MSKPPGKGRAEGAVWNPTGGAGAIHGLRHYYKWSLEQLGIKPSDIQIMMGHRSILSQEDYGRRAAAAATALAAARKLPIANDRGTAMTYSYRMSDDANTTTCDEEGLSLVSAQGCDVLVGLREMSHEELILIWQRFREELYAELASVFGKTRAEFNAWHVHSVQNDYLDGVLEEGSCIGFKRYATGSPKLHWFRQGAVVPALIGLGLIPAVTPHGKPRQNVSRGNGGAPALCQALPLEDQRRVIGRVFESVHTPLDDILHLNQTSLLDLESTEAMLRAVWDAPTALDRLAGALYAFDREQKVLNERTNRSGDGRRFGAAWFCAYLAREGYVLLPRLANAEYLTPRALAPLLWTFFVPAASRDLARHLVEAISAADWQYVAPVLRELVLYTNLFRSTDFGIDQLLCLKAEYTVADVGRPARASAAQLGHGLNRLFDAYAGFHGKSWEDVGQDARFFGGGRRIAGDHGRDAFDWVDDPETHRLLQYREILGDPPEAFAPSIRAWAAELRALLPAFGVASPTGKIVSLNLWLIYLIKLGEEAPPDLRSIKRDRHINHVGLGVEETFVDFLRGLDRGNKMKVISDLQKAWYLASLQDGFAGKVSCPIDVRMDNPGDEAPRSGGRTRRKSIPEDVYNILVEENRRDDFSFARGLTIVGSSTRRGLKVHWRTLVNPATGSDQEVFWPAMPIALDLVLRMGMRSGSALWMDSGEGDETWVDRATLEPVANFLATRTTGRSEGFLRVFRVGPAEWERVLGMYLAVNKTGPYGAAWVDRDSAASYERMRDLQVRYNPRGSPLPANRSDLDLAYAGPGTIPLVYPVFRDPNSRSAHPPTRSTLDSYWTAFLRHCEPIVQRRLGRVEPLIVGDKARWDLHSLRVTTVTVLLKNGVDPWIVADLTGHQSLAMLWHYKEINHGDMHRSLQAAHERIRQRALEKVQRLLDEPFAGSEAEWHDRLKSILGGLITIRTDNVGPATLRVGRSEGAAHEVFAHGMCPGADCGDGGREYKNAHQPVFRPRACSRCRYRITGPAFLAGLVHRCNSLMTEIRSSVLKEEELNAEIEGLEDEGKSCSGRVLVLRGLVTRHRELRDELWEEWCAEMATVKQAEQIMDAIKEEGMLPIVAGVDVRLAKTQLATVHELSMMHMVLMEANVINGASLEVPDGLREKRDALILEVARNNGDCTWLYKLTAGNRRRALDAYGEILLDHVASGEDLRRLIAGETQVGDRPALALEIEGLAGRRPDDGDLLHRAARLPVIPS